MTDLRRSPAPESSTQAASSLPREQRFCRARGVDGRTAPARRYRDLYQQFVQRHRGRSECRARTAIARRAAQLCVVLEQSEANYLRGGGVDIGEYTTASNAMRRLLADLGIKRVARDVTPSLAATWPPKPQSAPRIRSRRHPPPTSPRKQNAPADSPAR